MRKLEHQDEEIRGQLFSETRGHAGFYQVREAYSTETGTKVPHTLTVPLALMRARPAPTGLVLKSWPLTDQSLSPTRMCFTKGDSFLTLWMTVWPLPLIDSCVPHNSKN